MKNRKLILMICIFINYIIISSNLMHVYSNNIKKIPPNSKNAITYKQLRAFVININKKYRVAGLGDSESDLEHKCNKVESVTKDIEKFLNTKESMNLNKKQFGNLNLSRGC